MCIKILLICAPLIIFQDFKSHSNTNASFPNGCKSNQCKENSILLYSKALFTGSSNRHLPMTYHTMTLLTFLLPSVSTFIYHVSILIQTLTGQPRITFRATEKIHGWVFTVTDHPSTQDQATLVENENNVFGGAHNIFHWYNCYYLPIGRNNFRSTLLAVPLNRVIYYISCLKKMLIIFA